MGTEMWALHHILPESTAGAGKETSHSETGWLPHKGSALSVCEKRGKGDRKGGRGGRGERGGGRLVSIMCDKNQIRHLAISIWPHSSALIPKMLLKICDSEEFKYDKNACLGDLGTNIYQLETLLFSIKYPTCTKRYSRHSLHSTVPCVWGVEANWSVSQPTGNYFQGHTETFLSLTTFNTSWL